MYCTGPGPWQHTLRGSPRLALSFRNKGCVCVKLQVGRELLSTTAPLLHRAKHTRREIKALKWCLCRSLKSLIRHPACLQFSLIALWFLTLRPAVWPESRCTWPGITWSSRERSSPSCSRLCQSLAGLADTTPSPSCRWHSSAAETPAPGHKHKQISAVVAAGAPRSPQVRLLLREPPGPRPQGSPARGADTSAFSRAAQSGRSPAAAPPALPSLPGAAHAFAWPPAHPRARGCPRGPSTSGSAGPAARPHLRGLAGGLGQLLGELAQQAVGHGVLADVGLDGEHGHGGGGGADGGSGAAETARAVAAK